jgi:PAS domain S-box-containing protein
MGIIFAIIIVVVLTAIWTNYETSRANLVSTAGELRLITEEHIDKHLRLIHTGLKIYDSMGNEEMADAFGAVMAEYNRTGGDLSPTDLARLKSGVKGMEVQMINSSYAVEYSTDPEGSPVLPLSLVTSLAGIWGRSGFFPDRTVQDENTGMMTKTGYMATPDHRYIIGIELKSNQISEERTELQYNDIDDEARDLNPYLREVRLFQSKKRLIDNASYIPTPEESAMLDYLMLVNRTSQVVRDTASGVTVVWLPVDMRDPDYITDMSFFVKLVYDDTRMTEEQAALALQHAVAALLVLVSGGLLAVTVSRRVARPLEQLVEDVDAVAAGDLDHPIRPVAWHEFATLAEKTGIMVDRLKEQIHQREASEQRFEDLVRLLPVGVFESDREGNVIFANPAAMEGIGIDAGDLARGVNVFSVIAPEDRARARESFGAILKGGGSHGSEYTGLRSDGTTLPMLVYTAARYEDGAVAGVRGSFVDIGRLKEIEAEMRQLNAELEERVRRRTHDLESFTYSVSHDLRAPLRAIDGYSAILESSIGPGLKEKDQHYLEEVRRTVRQMGGLIEGLLGLSRLDRQELVREEIAPAPMVIEVISDALEQEPGRKVEVTVGDLPPCSADPAMLRQVFVNLVGNAVKFTRQAEEPRVEIGATVIGHETAYFVRDNGVGFNQADAEKVFRPFQRLRRADEFEGSGIGLATVERIVNRHGGRIWAESTPGEGSTFYFTLPGG